MKKVKPGFIFKKNENLDSFRIAESPIRRRDTLRWRMRLSAESECETEDSSPSFLKVKTVE